MALAANSLEGKAKPFLERIENLNAQLESLRGKYMNDCKPFKEDIAEIFVEAKDKGVNPKALRLLVKDRQLERQQLKLPEKLDIDERAVFDQLREALGDLGRAAAVKAGHAPKEDDADLRPTALKQAEKDRADEAELQKLGKGKDAKSEAVDSLAR